MFEKFGEFNTVEELNMAAEGLKNEGDINSVILLAKENGLTEDDARDYADGYSDSLTSEYMMALGRIDIEMEIYKGKPEEHMIKVIGSMAKSVLNDDTALAGRIFSTGKNLNGVVEKLRNIASKNKAGEMGCACGTDEELKDIIRAYYKEAAEK